MADVFAIRGGSVRVAQCVGGKFDLVADSNDVIGIERAEHQSLRMQIPKRTEDGIKNFARFLWTER